MTIEKETPLSTVFEVLDLATRCYPPEIQAVVEAELPGLKMRALRLALEIASAEDARLAFADAVAQPMSYPLMTKLHHGAIAMLQSEVPPKALDNIRYLFARLVREDVVDLRDAVLSATVGQTVEGALLRFLLYQAARIDRWMRTWNQPAFEATGALAQIDREAQDTLEFWLNLSTSLPDVSPLRLADAQVMLRLKTVGIEKLHELRMLQADGMKQFQAILSAATMARELNFEDSVVLRNEYQEYIGEQRLASAEIAEMYPSSFPSVNSVDKRAERVRTSIRDDDLSTARGAPRLLDVMQLISDQIEKETA